MNLGLAGDMKRVEIDARVGGKFYFSDMRDGTEARHWGTYLELDRPREDGLHMDCRRKRGSESFHGEIDNSLRGQRLRGFHRPRLG